MADSPRILELRRRVEANPASIAFAQLAEEYRRAGANEEAVGVCRAGLATYPEYLSARITLGRALIELGRLDEARQELLLVVETAPDNLPAIRGLAEIHQRRGEMTEALDYYKRALILARFDEDLESKVGHIMATIEPQAPAPVVPAVPVEELFDFDKLLEQMGEPQLPVPPAPAPVEATSAPPAIPTVPTPVVVPIPVLADVPLDDADGFADLERGLREIEEQRARDEAAARQQVFRRRREAVVSGLESWLSAIVADCDRHTRA